MLLMCSMKYYYILLSKKKIPNPNQSATGNIYLEGRGKCPGAGMELGSSVII